MSRSIGGSAIPRHVLVDGGNLIHRAYHIVKGRGIEDPNISNSSFTSTKSIGLLNTYLREILRYDSINVFFDGKSGKREQLFPEYKAHRISKNVLSASWANVLSDNYLVKSELELFIHLLKLLGCNVYFNPNFEADDLIASFVMNNPSDMKIIISDDKDFFQLLSDPRTVIYRPGDSSHNKFYDAERSTLYWTKLLKGSHPAVKPTQIRMFKSLCGDASDNIKGVSRLHKKVAISLCDYPSPDHLLNSGLAGLLESDRKRIIDSKDLIKMNWELVGFENLSNISEYMDSGTKDIEKFRLISDQDLNSHVQISSFCNVDHVQKFSVLPDWYNDL